MIVYENFLKDIDFQHLRNTIFDLDFSWNFNEISVDEGATIPQFTHLFFWDLAHRDTFKILNPLIDFVQPKSLHRVKANLNYRTEKIVETGMHTDADERFTSAILYLNDNNGYTRIGNKKVESKANRLLVFPSNIEHTGSTCTNASRRVVINMVYINQ